ncbi:unnamed protein product [Amoebophrya sp. A25]|nr:unnamed protein product [Amoebophrya sp. A25]|eukprot:GSA25T00014098001.1
MGNCQGKDGTRKSLSFYMGSLRGSEVRKDLLEDRLFGENLKFLERVALFSRLPTPEMPRLNNAMTTRNFQPGEKVISEGDHATEFFLVKTGEAAVFSGDTRIAVLKCGDYFGESSLLEEGKRNATIVAEGKLVVLSITRETFESLELHKKLRLPRRRAVLDNPVAAAPQAAPAASDSSKVAKTPEELVFVEQGVRENKFLKGLISSEQAMEIAETAYKMPVPEPGTVVVAEGDINADKFYVIAEGEFACRRTGHTNTQHYGPGDSFGELALLYNAPRAATVTAMTKGVFWVIDRAHFRRILQKQVSSRLKFYMKLIQRVEILSTLLQDERDALIESFTEMQYKKGQDIIREGSVGDTFFLLFHGSVVVRTESQGPVRTMTANVAANDFPYFGEQALMRDDVRNATITVASDTAGVLCLTRHTFETLLGPLRDIIRQASDARVGGCETCRQSHVRNYQKNRATTQLSGMKAACPKFGQLKELGVLGFGGFGSVTLQQDASTRRLFALKKISKGYVIQQSLQKQICNERLILSMTDSQFIVRRRLVFLVGRRSGWGAVCVV